SEAYGVGPPAEPLRSQPSVVRAMMANELWLVYALIFGAVLLAIQGAYWVLFKERGERKKINRRLALTAELGNPSEVLQALRKERGADVLVYLPSLENLKQLVVQSGVQFTVMVLLVWFAVPAVLFYGSIRSALGWNVLSLGLRVRLGVRSSRFYLKRPGCRRLTNSTDNSPNRCDST